LSAHADEAPDFAEPLEGWRAWRVVAGRDGYRLASLIKSTLWPPGEPLVAECLRTVLLPRRLRRRRGLHSAPELRCECGIYGTTLEGVEQYVNEPAIAPEVARVVGRVALWGTVIECERGFRASSAYPTHAYVPVEDDGLWAELEDGLAAYRIPVDRVAGPGVKALRALV
jgi:hypothetical protein